VCSAAEPSYVWWYKISAKRSRDWLLLSLLHWEDPVSLVEVPTRKHPVAKLMVDSESPILLFEFPSNHTSFSLSFGDIRVWQTDGRTARTITIAGPHIVADRLMTECYHSIGTNILNEHGTWANCHFSAFCHTVIIDAKIGSSKTFASGPWPRPSLWFCPRRASRPRLCSRGQHQWILLWQNEIMSAFARAWWRHLLARRLSVGSVDGCHDGLSPLL